MCSCGTAVTRREVVLVGGAPVGITLRACIIILVALLCALQTVRDRAVSGEITGDWKPVLVHTVLVGARLLQLVVRSGDEVAGKEGVAGFKISRATAVHELTVILEVS